MDYYIWSRHVSHGHGSHVRPGAPFIVVQQHNVPSMFRPTRARTVALPWEPCVRARTLSPIRPAATRHFPTLPAAKPGPFLRPRQTRRPEGPRHQSVFRSRACTMTALRAIVGVCSKYVKVSERHVLLIVRFGCFTRLVVAKAVVVPVFLALRRSPTVSVVKRCPRPAITVRLMCVRYENTVPLLCSITFCSVMSYDREEPTWGFARSRT